ncbi:MAG: radical SAM protein [Ignavibacteriae bacterium]|nr:radical SAM protein [Ignavibacteriota bacterium]NOG97719.1 radical SAM protein [Ignavibacteriota bacterium]
MIFSKTNNQDYNAWLHWNISSQCNFNCEYCFGKTPFVKNSINKINIEKLIEALDKTGKTFRISFTGGEPFLIPNIIEACSTITEKHFVSFNTNLVLPGVKEFAESILPERVLFFHASLHIEELIKLNLVDKFAANFNLLRANGFKIFAEAVAHPSLNESDINYFRDYLSLHEINFSFGPFIGEYNNKAYPQNYSDDELEKFNLENENMSVFKQKGNICNAGFNAAVVYPNGNVHSCFQVKEKLGNIYSEINFKKKTKICPAANCDCPLNYYDPHLFSLVH